jgi:putative transposase
MRNDAHFWATMNYVHHNPVRHGYVERWQDWPFSSALEYLQRVGPQQAARIWQTYPLLDYGEGWDDPEL